VTRDDAALSFYEFLTSNIRTEEMGPTRRYYGDDFCVMEHEWTGTVPGEFLGVPGHGRRISFRLLHVWEFRDGGSAARTSGSTEARSWRSSPRRSPRTRDPG
jgi:hypothetical protein